MELPFNGPLENAAQLANQARSVAMYSFPGHIPHIESFGEVNPVLSSIVGAVGAACLIGVGATLLYARRHPEQLRRWLAPKESSAEEQPPPTDESNQ